MTAMLSELQRLKGATILDIRTEPPVYGDNRPVYALVLRLANDKIAFASILQDAEGNGPGFLDIFQCAS